MLFKSQRCTDLCRNVKTIHQGMWVVHSLHYKNITKVHFTRWTLIHLWSLVWCKRLLLRLFYLLSDFTTFCLQLFIPPSCPHRSAFQPQWSRPWMYNPEEKTHSERSSLNYKNKTIKNKADKHKCHSKYFIEGRKRCWNLPAIMETYGVTALRQKY